MKLSRLIRPIRGSRFVHAITHGFSRYTELLKNVWQPCIHSLIANQVSPPVFTVVTVLQVQSWEKMNFSLVSLIFILYLSSVSALYFHIAETERKCFIEEIPDETMVIGNYSLSSSPKYRCN